MPQKKGAAGTTPSAMKRITVIAASDLLKPCDARLMRCYPVSTRINHVANDDEGCSAPVVGGKIIVHAELTDHRVLQRHRTRS